MRLESLDSDVHELKLKIILQFARSIHETHSQTDIYTCLRRYVLFNYSANSCIIEILARPLKRAYLKKTDWYMNEYTISDS